MTDSKFPSFTAVCLETNFNDKLSRGTSCASEFQQEHLLGSITSSQQERSGKFEKLLGVEQLALDTWTFEYCALVLSTGSLFTIFLTLGLFDGHALHEWTYSLNINTVLSSMATLMKGATILAVAAALGQLKWSCFTQEMRPLKEFRIIDDASRGPIGAIELLYRMRKGRSALLGAIVVLLALGVDVLVQASATVSLRSIQVSNNATVPICKNYSKYSKAQTAAQDFMIVESSMRASIYSGLLQQSTDLSGTGITPTCSTGSCDFGEYHSMGVCSSCFSRNSDMILDFETDNSVKSVNLPIHYADGRSATNLTISVDNSTVMYNGFPFNSTTFANISSQYPWNFTYPPTIVETDILMIDWPDDDIYIYASHCSLHICVKRYAGKVEQGVFQETVMEETFLNTYDSDWNAIFEIKPNAETESEFVETFEAVFNVSSFLLIGCYLGGGTDEHCAEGGAGGMLTGSGAALITNNGSVDYQWVWTNVMVQALFINGLHDISGTFSNLADSISNNMRTMSGVLIYGTTISRESYIHARWAFMLPPTAMVILAIVFVGMVSWESRKHDVPIWKTSSLASIIHAGKCVEGNTASGAVSPRLMTIARGAHGLVQVSEMELWAEKKEVRMRRHALHGRRSKTTMWHSLEPGMW